MLVETKGDIPNTFMHAFEDNKRQTNEIEHLKKITKDYSEVNKKVIDENAQLKKEIAQLRQALSQTNFPV